MTKLWCRVAGKLEHEEGTTAVEYAVLVALIAVGLIVTLTTLRGAIDGLLARMIVLFNGG